MNYKLISMYKWMQSRSLPQSIDAKIANRLLTVSDDLPNDKHCAKHNRYSFVSAQWPNEEIIFTIPFFSWRRQWLGSLNNLSWTHSAQTPSGTPWSFWLKGTYFEPLHRGATKNNCYQRGSLQYYVKTQKDS